MLQHSCFFFCREFCSIATNFWGYAVLQQSFGGMQSCNNLLAVCSLATIFWGYAVSRQIFWGFAVSTIINDIFFGFAVSRQLLMIFLSGLWHGWGHVVGLLQGMKACYKGAMAGGGV